MPSPNLAGVAFIHWRVYCIPGLARARFIEGLPALGSHVARRRLVAIHACISSIIICLYVLRMDGGRPRLASLLGVTQGSARPGPHRDPIKSSHDLIEPMAFILAVRVSERASDTHMPSSKMSRQRYRNLFKRF